MLINIEDRKIAELVSINPLKLNTIKRHIHKRIEYLKEDDTNLSIIAYLTHILEIMKIVEFRILIRTIKESMKKIN